MFINPMASKPRRLAAVRLDGSAAVPVTHSIWTFRVDTFAIESYSSAGQGSPIAGSLSAPGVVDNLVLTTPPAPVMNLRGSFLDGRWQVSFLSRTNWSYVLEATQNFQFWSEVSGPIPGTVKE